ncbi:aromatic acid/H+ symport family MFS transporter [Acinetobacter sp. ANC 4558]|uniref:MFS transporter n=1 Tax=Acinetobacter sp. ANC 4558 TaxID=1977876 RepID=UPI000A3447FE|nr:MFS transporter [Acinetobacter sp. ANC 4558]OTG87175.1 aromatic acid/H+ symport family MFS transporter [Acinetobacter sp. ANC 4558]
MNMINVSQIVDEAPMNKFHWSLIFFCTLIIIFDGYDLVVYGVALPLLMQEWSIDSITAGIIGSVALVGMMFGAFLFGSLADKYEHKGVTRKKIIIICIMLFSFFTMLCGFSDNPIEFSIYRFIAGLGIGGVMPNVIAHVGEFAPKKVKSFFVTLMFSGYAIGGMFGAVLGSALIPMYGWQIIFFIAGVPLLVLIPIYKFLPESIESLVRQGKRSDVIKYLQKISPQYKYQDYHQYILNTPINHKMNSPVSELFSQGRLISTLMFWLSIFMTLLMVYALGSWLPKLMIEAGYNLSKSLYFLFALNIGGMIGAILGGFLADRYNIKYILITIFLLGAISLYLMTFKLPIIALYILIACSGMASIGAQIIISSYMTKYYPSNIRTTGIGWALGFGRLGAILGPILIGWILVLNLSYEYYFLAICIPAIIAMVAIIFVNDKRSAFQLKSVPNSQS